MTGEGAEGVWPKLTKMGFPKDAFCGAITSGELAHRFLRDRPSPAWQELGRSCVHLTWGERGSISLEGLDLQVCCAWQRHLQLGARPLV